MLINQAPAEPLPDVATYRPNDTGGAVEPARRGVITDAAHRSDVTRTCSSCPVGLYP